MVHEFPKRTQKQPDDSELRIRLDMTFDVPKEIADQLEMWGFNTFEDCEYDSDRRQLKMSASTLQQEQTVQFPSRSIMRHSVIYQRFCLSHIRRNRSPFITAHLCGRAAGTDGGL